MEIRLKVLREGALLPAKGSEMAAGSDLYALPEKETVVIEPHRTAMIGTGLAAAIPEGYFGGIFARSGLASKMGLRPANCVGVVDSDYRGEIIVAIHNLFSATVQPFSMPLSAGLRAAGDVQFTMWASIFCTVVCRTLLSFILAKWLGLGVIGIALAMAMDWCIKAGLDIWRFRSGKWKGRHVI